MIKGRRETEVPFSYGALHICWNSISIKIAPTFIHAAADQCEWNVIRQRNTFLVAFRNVVW